MLRLIKPFISRPRHLLSLCKKSLVSYERKSPVEHVLLRPGMYIGQVELVTTETWLYNTKEKKMIKEHIQYNPALLKIFDEILVNAADNRQRDKTMSLVEIAIRNCVGGDLEISVKNDGKSLPIDLHKKENIYIPELVFGHLLTGSNFNDTDNRLTGGSHGYGAKLTNIFSNSFTVETHDGKKKVSYEQTWTNNMSNMSPPTITSADSSDSFTKITFQPDLRKFGGFNDENVDRELLKKYAIRLFQRRALDIAACIAPVKVNFTVQNSGDCHGEIIDIPSIYSFQDYVHLFQPVDSISNVDNKVVLSDEQIAGGVHEIHKSSPEESAVSSNNINDNTSIVFEKPSPRWEVAVGPSSTGTFENMSFVNGVWTVRGGSHVNLVTAQIVKAIEVALSKKGITSTPTTIRNKMMVFVNCNIENPSFDGQTKDALNTKPAAFGSTCVLSKAVLKEIIEKTGIIDSLVLDSARREANKLLVRSKSRKNSLISVPKLEDAHAAGTDKSLECTLILTEGDSAKALAVAGLEVVGRKLYGVLPLRGKIINVRSSANKQVFQNEEFLNICKAVGLNFNNSYPSGLENQGLRYGKVMIMCDQDTDGSHIKGLVINLFHHFWPNLLKYDGFLQQFITPIVKAKPTGGPKRNKDEVLSFFSIPEFKKWQEDRVNSALGTANDGIEIPSPDNLKLTKKYNIKYYKGLGTNTAAEGKEYFAALDQHCKRFQPLGAGDANSIDLAFNKDRTNDRKDWLTGKYDSKVFLDPHLKNISYTDFIHKELIHFSYGDIQRSIPSVVDGLKPSQRKALYGCLKKNLINEEMKVVQIAGYIAEHTAYHHGEFALHDTIIKMAQDFVGSNNVPLLVASGQFGTRAQGGNDHASPRYVFTRLSPITRVLFPAEDDELLEFAEEDGITVEPRHFIPVLPTLLLNGSHGIGTGWSTFVPTFHLPDVVEQVRSRIQGTSLPPPLKPYVVGFQGEITPGEPVGIQYNTAGIINRTGSNKLVISELPCGIWTNDYKKVLLNMMEKGVIKEFLEMHSSNKVRYEITSTKDKIDSWMTGKGLESAFRLCSSLSLANMHAFDRHGKICRYRSAADIIDAHFEVRFEAYQMRKAALERKHAADEIRAGNQSRFIACILNGDIQVIQGQSGSPTSAANLVDKLRQRGFADEGLIERVRSGVSSTASSNTSITATVSSSSLQSTGGYSYLLDLPIFSLTDERSLKLQSYATEAAKRLKEVELRSVEDMWLADLDKVSDAYEKSAAKRALL